MPIPQPKTAELADRLNAELHKPRSDEMTLKRLERDIVSLQQAADSNVRMQALMLLGVLEGLRFDVDSSKRMFEQALAASGYDPLVYVNYATTMQALGRFSDALSLIEKAADKSPDVMTLRLALKHASDAFALDRVDYYAAWLDRLKVPNDDTGVTQALHASAWQRELLRLPGVTREDVLARYQAARSVAVVHRVRVAHETAMTSMRGILVEWPVACTDEEVQQMNFEVIENLGRFEHYPGEMAISFGYRASEERVSAAA